MRFGLGPVFIYEWLTASRRWQMYAGRALFVLLLLAALLLVAFNRFGFKQGISHNQLSSAGEYFFYAVIGTQLALVLLAAPAATAGAICLDKSRGALLQLLATDLSNAEIVLGKLAARLLTVLGLIACGAPVLFLCMLLGGIDPQALLGAYLVTLAVAFLGCSLALTISIWGRKTHEVLLVNYAIWTAILLLAATSYVFNRIFAFPIWWKFTNPYDLAFAPYRFPGQEFLSEQLTYFFIAIALSVALIALSIWRVRAVTVRHAGRDTPAPSALRKRRRLPRLLPRPSLDRSPVLWREWHRKRPSGWIVVVWTIYAICALGFTAFALWNDLADRQFRGMTSFVNAFLISIGYLMLSVTAVTSLAEERLHGSLDLLLTTPLSAGTILWGKWRGVYRDVLKVAFLPLFAVGVFCLSPRVLGEPWKYLNQPRFYMFLLIAALVLVQGAALTSLGLFVAVRIARFGLAIALNVAAYVAVTVGWVFFVIAVADPSVAPKLAIASPFWGVGYLTSRLPHDDYPGMVRMEYAALGWCVFYSIAAVFLYLTTLWMFNRRLGRITKRRQPKAPASIASSQVIP